MAPSNQTAVLRPPKKEGAEISSTPDGTRQNEPPKRILEIAYAFWRSKALLSAVELGVFTMLAEGPLDLATLTRRTGIHERGARDFFDALVALGALRRDADGRYENDPEFDLYLDRRKPTYLGGLLEHLNARHYQNWGLLTAALRTGAPPSGGVGTYKALHDGHPMQEIFLSGMTAGSLLAAQAIAAKFPWGKFSTMIDIGTAQGGAAVEIACAHSHLTGGGFRPTARRTDLHALCRETRPVGPPAFPRRRLLFRSPAERRCARDGAYPSQLGSADAEDANSKGLSSPPARRRAHRVRPAYR